MPNRSNTSINKPAVDNYKSIIKPSNSQKYLNSSFDHNTVQSNILFVSCISFKRAQKPLPIKDEEEFQTENWIEAPLPLPVQKELTSSKS